MTTTAPLRQVELTAFGAPENLRVRTVSPTAELASGSARVRVLASSLTLSDSIVRRGLNPYTHHLAQPFTLGYDFVGEVVETAGAAGGLAVGDLVVDLPRWGSNADEVVRPVAELTPVRVDVDPVRLEPLVMTGMTALQSLRLAGPLDGTTVLVHGATGGVGLLLAELAVRGGARVLATGSPVKLDALRERGALPLDGRADDLAERIRAFAPDGVDAVFDGVGGTSRAVVAATLRAPDGVFVGFGFAGPASTAGTAPPGHTAAVLAEGRAVVDRLAAAGHPAVEYEVGGSREQDRAAYDRDLDALARMVAAGDLRPEVRAVAVDDVVRGHRDVDAGAVTGRLVLDHGRAAAWPWSSARPA